MTSKGDVIARYGNFYRGDDDLFTHCLILRDGQCWLLGQGLRPVTLRNFKAPASQFKKLTAALASIPASWAKASYAGYNFITDAESATASEIAVYGAQPGGSLPGDFDYFVPPPDSDVAKLVKAIARIDSPGPVRAIAAPGYEGGQLTTHRRVERPLHIRLDRTFSRSGTGCSCRRQRRTH
jgi:hypothetical protein